MIMKKIVFSIIFLVCSSLFSLEKQSFLTTYLEPSFPLVLQKANAFDKAWHFYKSQIELSDETYKSILIHYLDSLLTACSDPLYQKKLLTSLPVIECIIAPLANAIYPHNPLQLLLGNNWMMFEGRKHHYNAIKLIIDKKIKTLSEREQNNILLLQYIMMSVSSILIVAASNDLTPDLFAKYTYLDPLQLAGSYGLLPYCVSFFLFNNKSRTEKIGIHTQYFNYSLYQLLKDIDTIFEAKKILFLTSIILAFFFLKPKNNIFTDPAYWVPIGIAHLLYTKYNCPNVLFKKTCNILHIRYNVFNYINRNAAKYIVFNAVPILAVSMNSMIQYKKIF